MTASQTTIQRKESPSASKAARPAGGGGTASASTVQLKSALAGRDFAAQEAMLAPPVQQKREGGGTPIGTLPGPVQKKDDKNGLVGGKVTYDDYAKEAGVSNGDKDKAGDKVKETNAMTLAQVKAMFGSPKPVARSEKEMLAAIGSGVLPRWVARVHKKANFDAGSFGTARADQCFATEPADLLGLKPAEALIKVGWTEEWLRPMAKENAEIAVCIFDTQASVKDDKGADKTTSVTAMNWDTLAAAAMDPAKNKFFRSQLANFKDDATGTVVEEKDLPTLFDIWKKSPVGGEPRTDDPTLKIKCKLLRKVMDKGLGANQLYSGMGATVGEDGKTGAREVMVQNNGTGFKLEPGKNCEIIPIGVLNEAGLNALLGPPKTAP